MERIIRVTSDSINEERSRALAFLIELVQSAKKEFSFSSPVFKDIVIAPELNDHALGFFNDKYLLIVINESVMELDLATRNNILIHELAHALDYAITGTLSGHSPFFRHICQYLEIDEGFDKSKLKQSLIAMHKKHERIEKLIALSSSPFENEAMQALKKARDLMLSNTCTTSVANEEKLYFAPIYSSGRTPHYITCILSFVSEATGVFIVRSKHDDQNCSTCYGKFEQVEFALYLFDFILASSDSEVKKNRKNGIKITKDSFIIGALPEMRKQLSNTSADTVHALMKIKNENMLLSKKLVFTKAKLRTKKYTSSVNDGKSFDIGKKFGAKIDIPKKIDIKILT